MERLVQTHLQIQEVVLAKRAGMLSQESQCKQICQKAHE